MALRAYEVRNCYDSVDIRYISSTNDTLVVGSSYTFTLNGESICAEVLLIGRVLASCIDDCALPVISAQNGYEDPVSGYTIDGECECPTTSLCGTLQCAPGFTLVDGVCRKETIEGGTLNPTTYTAAGGSTIPQYGEFGARFYANADSYNYPLLGDSSTSVLHESITGTPLPFTVIQDGGTNGVWQSTNDSTGRLNIAGIWTGEADGYPIVEWIGYARCVDIPETTTYCIGIAADNRMRIRINDQTVAIFDNDNDKNFKYFHVIEVTLTAGANIIAIEGYNEGPSAAAFAAEIYETDITTLQAVTSVPQLEALILWSTKDRIGEEFDIGEESGYTCPDGTLFDSCTGENQCVSIQIVPAEGIECCYRITNCLDTDETYLIKFDENETNPLYQDTILELNGNISLFQGKCFRLVGIEVCSEADVTGVTVAVDHGDNCFGCTQTSKFVNCNTNQNYNTPPIEGLTPGNIYDFTSVKTPGCFTYLGDVTGEAPNTSGAIIKTDYGPGTCLICDPCYTFEDCLTSEQITVRFATQPNSNGSLPGYEQEGGLWYNPQEFWIDNIFKIYGDPAVDGKCFKFVGESTCEGEADYQEVGVKPVYEYGNPGGNNYSQDCIDCCPRYTLTDCTDPENQLVIIWDCESELLDESLVYRFNATGIDPNTCWTVELIPNPQYFYNRS